MHVYTGESRGQVRFIVRPARHRQDHHRHADRPGDGLRGMSVCVLYMRACVCNSVFLCFYVYII